MNYFQNLNITPSIARYTFMPVFLIEFVYLYVHYRSKMVLLCQAPFVIPTVVCIFYSDYKGPIVQTKNQILFSLYGLTGGSFLWNIGEITGTDNEVN